MAEDGFGEYTSRETCRSGASGPFENVTGPHGVKGMTGRKVVLERLSRLVGAVALLGALLVWSTAVPALAQSASFTITARIDSGENGEIVPSGAVSVPAGGSQTFVLTASPGYKVAFVQVDGKSQGAISSFTFTGVSSNHTISAGFSPMTYTITVTSGPDGVVTPSSAVLFQHGDNQTYTIVPNPGYKIDRVVVDQTPQGPIDSYTFTSIRNDHTIVVEFHLPERGCRLHHHPAAGRTGHYRHDPD